MVLVVGVWAVVAAIPGAAMGYTYPAEERGLTATDLVELPEVPFSSQREPWLFAAGVGDVNGDGVRDYAAGLCRVGDGPSTVYVIFGAHRGMARSPQITDRPGFRIDVPDGVPGLAGLRDISGDGRDEVIVASENHVVVVFGKADDAPVDVAEVGSGGFTIENVRPRSGGGGDGVLNSSGVMAAGDQNGDGRHDVALVDDDAVKIIYTPAAPAGASIDGDALGSGGAAVAVGQPTFGGVLADTLEDANRDGRMDFALGFQETSGTRVHVFGILAPGPGVSTTAGALVAAGRAFELWDDESGLSRLTTLADQNGDGRREITVNPTAGDIAMRGIFTPAMGTRSAWGDVPGYKLSGSSHFVDVGDQDGDGRGDIGGNAYVRLSRDGIASPLAQIRDDGFYFQPRDGYRWARVIGTVADENGDQRPELLVGHVLLEERDALLGKEYGARYALERWDSAPVLIEPSIVVPSEPDPMDSGGDLPAATSSSSPDSTIGDSAPVTASRPAGVDAAGVRLRGLDLRGGPRADRLIGGPRADRLWGLGGDDVLLGRRGADTLLGGAGRDLLIGGAGQDLLSGGPGRDRLQGGPGADRLRLRDGARDVVDCGAGVDRVLADRRDVLHRCEQPRRSSATGPARTRPQWAMSVMR